MTVASQLVSLLLDMAIDPKSLGDQVIEWMVLQGVEFRDADERGKALIASMKTCEMVRDIARHAAADIDQRQHDFDGSQDG